MAACLRSRFLAMSRSSPPSSPSTSLNASAMARCSGRGGSCKPNLNQVGLLDVNDEALNTVLLVWRSLLPRSLQALSNETAVARLAWLIHEHRENSRVLGRR